MYKDYTISSFVIQLARACIKTILKRVAKGNSNKPTRLFMYIYK